MKQTVVLVIFGHSSFSRNSLKSNLCLSFKCHIFFTLTYKKCMVFYNKVIQFMRFDYCPYEKMTILKIS